MQETAKTVRSIFMERTVLRKTLQEKKLRDLQIFLLNVLYVKNIFPGTEMVKILVKKKTKDSKGFLLLSTTSLMLLGLLEHSSACLTLVDTTTKMSM